MIYDRWQQIADEYLALLKYFPSRKLCMSIKIVFQCITIETFFHPLGESVFSNSRGKTDTNVKQALSRNRCLHFVLLSACLHFPSATFLSYLHFPLLQFFKSVCILRKVVCMCACVPLISSVKSKITLRTFKLKM